jgi:hypothetical protein
MYKIIKEFKNEELIYKLGYFLLVDKVYSRIEIYKNGDSLSVGRWGSGAFANQFYFYSAASSKAYSVIDTIKEMFIELRKYSEIPEYIEEEYGDMFLLYKLNDFNEL